MLHNVEDPYSSLKQLLWMCMHTRVSLMAVYLGAMCWTTADVLIVDSR